MEIAMMPKRRASRQRAGRELTRLVLLLAGSVFAVLPTSADVVNLKLNGMLVSGGDVSWFQISPNGAWVVYLADQDTDAAKDLYSVPIGGGTPVRLNGALPTGSEVFGFGISTDSTRVVYHAPQDTTGVFELYSVPIEGPASAGIKLNRPLPLGGEVGNIIDRGFQISPDGSRVIYVADQEKDNVFELFSVPIDGPATAGVKLNIPLVDGGGVGDSQSFAISPDGSRVVYCADQEQDNVFELFSVPIDGPATAGVKLNGAMVPGGGVPSPFFWSTFQISPDNSRVLYIADQLTNDVYEVFSVPLTGPATAGVKLNGTLAPGGNVLMIYISPDSSRVVYWADQDTKDVFELYSVPSAGPAAAGVKLNGPLTPGGDVGGLFGGMYWISEDSEWVVYLADQETNDVPEIFGVPIAGPASAGFKLNKPLVSGREVTAFDISPNSNRVVYLADQETSGVLELYSVPLLGPATAGVKLNIGLGTTGDVQGFQVSPDGSRVLYNAKRIVIFPQFDDKSQIYSVPVDGPSTASVRLNGSLVQGGDVIGFWFAPDSSRVVYIADQDTDEVFELYVSNATTAADEWEMYE